MSASTLAELRRTSRRIDELHAKRDALIRRAVLEEQETLRVVAPAARLSPAGVLKIARRPALDLGHTSAAATAETYPKES